MADNTNANEHISQFFPLFKRALVVCAYDLSLFKFQKWNFLRRGSFPTRLSPLVERRVKKIPFSMVSQGDPNDD